jgi:hypothetical protein
MKDDVRFQAFTAVTMKNGVFWDTTPCGYCKNRHFGGTSFFIRVTRIGELGTTLAVTSNRRTLRVFLRSMSQLLVTANVVPSSQIFVTLMKEALSYSEMSVLTRATWRNIPEDILHCHRRENVNLTTERRAKARRRVRLIGSGTCVGRGRVTRLLIISTNYVREKTVTFAAPKLCPALQEKLSLIYE